MADELPDLTERLRIRRRSGRLRRWLPVLLALGALLVSLVALWVVRWSPALRTTDVVVNHTQLVSEQQVRDAAAVPVGTPLAGVDLAGVARRVSLLTPVQDVHVTRRWPHTVVIDVTERTVAYQRRVANGYQWVDSQGIVFRTVPASTKGLVSVATNGVDQPMLQGVATVVASLRPGTRAHLQSIAAATPDSITLLLSDNRTVVWGGADQSDLKAQVTQVLLDQKTQRVHVIDVSSPTHPTGR